MFFFIVYTCENKEKRIKPIKQLYNRIKRVTTNINFHHPPIVYMGYVHSFMKFKNVREVTFEKNIYSTRLCQLN